MLTAIVAVMKEIFTLFHSQIKKGCCSLLNKYLKLSKLAFVGINFWLIKVLAGFKAADNVQTKGKRANIITIQIIKCFSNFIFLSWRLYIFLHLLKGSCIFEVKPCNYSCYHKDINTYSTG